MPKPTLETFQAIIADQDIELAAEQLAAAVEAHAKLRPELERLREVELPLLPEAVEPQTALRWIENGGRSTGG
jgi:hypothetical protein